MSNVFPDPAIPPGITPADRTAERLSSIERRLRAIEWAFSGGSTQQVPVVDALPTAGRKGRIVVVDSTSKVYVDNGASWVLVGSQT